MHPSVVGLLPADAGVDDESKQSKPSHDRLDRDLDEAEEQHQFAIRTHLLNMETLMEIQDSRVEELREDFRKQVEAIEGDWAGEREELVQSAEKRKRELRHLVLEVIQEEKNKEQIDLTEHQASYELIRNKNIEEDHQMRSHLEEKIEAMKDKCNAALVPLHEQVT